MWNFEGERANCENLKAERPTSFCPGNKFSQIEPIFE